ncbi:MAG: hypothetical protein FJY55_14825 [Betaproteobacteria bacterium]|nr:hypothetical protein [Betaproteobacteria bacterium]
MFSYLHSRIRGTATTGPGEPPPGLVAFYWHFVGQIKGWYLLVLIERPLVMLADMVIRQNVLIPGATSLIRWIR